MRDYTHTRRADARAGLGLVLCIIMLSVAPTACEKPRDPVEVLKGIIPQIERAVNRRDQPALQSMGTARFDVRVFIAIMRGSRGPAATDSLALRFARVVFPRPTEAQLTLRASQFSAAGRAEHQVEIYFLLDGKWRINGCSDLRPDSTGAGG